jgi:hypothetical protein
MSTTYFGSLPDMLGTLSADVIDLQARVQEMEDRERLQTPCTRITALEQENADLKRRFAELEKLCADLLPKQGTKRRA